MGIDEMMYLVDKYGIKGGIFAVILFLLIVVFKSKWFGGILSKVSDIFIERFMRSKIKDVSTKMRQINDSDISNHDIFNYIDFWVYSKVPTFQFSTDYRTVVFRKYLTIYLKSYKTNISNFVKNNEYQEMDNPEVWKSLLDLINRIVRDYERDMDEVGIPKIVIEKMKAKNHDIIQLTIDLIEGVCNSQFYASDKNYLKVYSILNILLSVLENTISNSESVCNSINGAMKGLSFKDSTGRNIIEP